MTVVLIFQCPECDRFFDMFDEKDAADWTYGHDCEPVNEPKQQEVEL